MGRGIAAAPEDARQRLTAVLADLESMEKETVTAKATAEEAVATSAKQQRRLGKLTSTKLLLEEPDTSVTDGAANSADDVRQRLAEAKASVEALE